MDYYPVIKKDLFIYTSFVNNKIIMLSKINHEKEYMSMLRQMLRNRLMLFFKLYGICGCDDPVALI